MVAQGIFGNQIRGACVVVTGATSGIGYATARAFAGAGANLVVAGRRKDRLDELTAAISSAGGQALGVTTDVADPAQVDALVERAVERFGSLDVMVNNAGVGMAGAFLDVPLDEFRRLMDVNFWGVVYGCRAAVPVMQKQRRGVIINIASIAGKRGMPFNSAYCATKFAVVGLSEALRGELASSNIAVSVVCPGIVESEFAQSMGNKLGGQMPDNFPKYPASQLAQVILADARYPQPEVVLSIDAQMIDFMNTVAPRVLDATMAASAPFMQGAGTPAGGGTSGSLFRPLTNPSQPPTP